MKKIFLPILLMFCISLSGCRRVEEKEELLETTVTIKNDKDFTLFRATTKGPFLISIEGADVTLKMLKEEPGLEEGIEKEKKKAGK